MSIYGIFLSIFLGISSAGKEVRCTKAQTVCSATNGTQLWAVLIFFFTRGVANFFSFILSLDGKIT